VAMDEALLAMAMTPSRFPRRADYHRVSEELGEARLQYRRRGWLARPAGYHRVPPPLGDGDVEHGRGWALGRNYERISWESRFVPRPSEPGAERWNAYEPNHRATAAVLRSGEGPGPWIVGVHGFCMGYPFMDFVGLQAGYLHGRLGYNLALPVLPLHGSRKVTRVSGEPFLSFNLMNTVHGLAQAVWDIRRLLTWVRAQGATSVTLYGVSLGAYVVALLAGLEPVDTAVTGIPVVDFPRLFHEHSPVHIRARSIEHRILGGTAEDVFTVVSPLSFAPQVPVERRFVYAGYGDRLAFPEQARLLWEHWERPAIRWYPGNHVGYLWSREVNRFLEESLRSPAPSPDDTAEALAPSPDDAAEALAPGA
jgi:dienelactone hydrolase